MLFVDDDEGKVLELHTGAEQRVRPDDDIDFARLQIVVDLVSIRGTDKPVHEGDPRAERPEPLLKVARVLLAENGRWAQDGNLPAGLSDLERGSNRDLGFAKADVAAHKPIHRESDLEVELDLLNRSELARSLDVRERRLHLPLPRAVLAKRTTLNRFPLRVEAHQVSSELPGVLLGFSQSALPFTSG